MRSAFIRCGMAALAALVLWGGVQLLAITWICPPHHAWLRRQAGIEAPVADRGERVARPGDAIFTCERPHRTGPFVWHLDLDCYCAPAEMTAEQLGPSIGGTCVLDKLHPTPADGFGACRFARCTHHLGVD